MRMYRMRFLLILVSVVLIASCVRNKNGQTNQEGHLPNEKVFEVSEVVQATSYTYLKVKENSVEKWMAVSKADIEPGDVYYYDEALQMTSFHSKDLDRTFDVIYFVNQISEGPAASNKMANVPEQSGAGHAGKVDISKKSNITLEKDDNEVTVARIFEQRDAFSGKETEIRGVVVKVNKSIMSKNWIHIQDGTGSGENYDLTITSQDLAEVNDEVTFSGVIRLNKDFGAGYFYEVIMEDATLVEKSAGNLSL